MGGSEEVTRDGWGGRTKGKERKHMDTEEDIYGMMTDGGAGYCGAVSAKVYDGGTWYVTTRLSDLVGAEIVEREDEETGESVRGLFLPFRTAGLTVTPKKNVLLVCRAEAAQVASAKYTHLLTQVAGQEALEERARLGFRQGFVGHMRPAHRKGRKRQYTDKRQTKGSI